MGFHTISNTLGRLDHSPNPQFDYLFSEEEFEELGENINNLADVFAVQNYRIRECIQSLTGIPQDEIWDAPSFGERVDYAEEAVPAPHSDNIHDWLADETTPRSPNITGQNLRSLNQITRRLDRDFSELEAKKGNTLVGYEPDVKYPLFLSGLLLVIGVFLPMLFIMSPPSQLLQLDRTTIYIVQWVLVLGTLISSLNLLRLLANRISGSS